jgi:trigger factor
MVATKNVERLEHSSVKLTVTVAQADVRKEYASLLAEYAKNVKMDGFRVGKVPTPVLERKFGEELKLEAMGRVMEKSVEEAVKDIEEKPIVYSTPTLEGEPKFDLDSDFAFSVVYDTFPIVPVADWKGLEIEVPEVKVAAADEERELNELRDRNAIVVEKEAGAAAVKGDVATANYKELDETGAAVAGSERQDFTFEIGTGYNIYKFDDEILGMKKGETKVIEKSFPADFEYKELAGRKVKVEVQLTNLKGKKLPELDDDLAQDVSEKYKTLADLKADIRKQLEKRLEDRLRQEKEKGIVAGLLSRVTVDVPASMVEAEIMMRLDNLKSQMGITADEQLDRLLAYSGKTRADLTADWKAGAEKSIATRLVLEKLVEDGKYECTDADLDAEWKRMADEASLSVEEVKVEYEKRGSLEYLKDRIKEDKLMASILAEAKVKKGKKLSFVDLFADNE